MDEDIRKIIYRALINNNFLTLYRIYAGDWDKLLKELDNKLKIKLTE